MRLLWVSHLVPYPPKSGVHLRSFNLLKSTGLSQDVDLVAFIQRSWISMFFPNFEAGIEECRTQLLKYCTNVTFLPIESQDRPYGRIRSAIASLLPGYCYSVRWLQGKNAARTIEAVGRRERYDLAHFDTIGLAPYRALLPDVPATLGHHNIESHMLLRRAGNEPSLAKKIYFLQEGMRLRRYEAKVADHFSAHVTCSDLDSERLHAIAPGCRAVAIPNGVDVEYFRARGMAEQLLSVIFVGSFNWYPNAAAADFLLREIWPLVQSRIPGVRLDIVGSGPSKSLRELAETYDNVKVHGFVDDVRPMIEAASVYVCPIRDGGGTKLKLLDAFAMEKCVVAHPLACEGIDAVPGVSVLQASTAEDFASSLDVALRDMATRRAIGAAARRLVVDKYAFDTIGKALQDVFVSCVDGRGVSKEIDATRPGSLSRYSAN
jgi:glycosyltransferase involved in cell wall biosynthesis